MRRGAAGMFAAAMLVIGHSSAQAAHPRHHHHRGTHHARGLAPADHDAEATARSVGTDASGAWQQVGVASYYGPRHNGRRTASGTTFDQGEMTAAHRSLPFGTRVLVTAQGTGRQVIVTITDRCPSRRRVIDLSTGAARELGILHQGTAVVVLTKT